MTAVILHGNLRTFFMPLREDGSLRICDLFYSNVVKPNNADIFVVTDTTDFYHNGVHYFDDSQKDQIKDTSSTMFHSTVGFMGQEKSKALLATEIKEFFKDNLKALKIYEPIDISADPKFILLSDSISKDSTPKTRTIKLKASLVNQYIKIKFAYDLLREYEIRNSIYYDLIFRGRFDNMYGRHPINISSFDYGLHDIFVPGFVDGLLVFDWCAFGKRSSMGLALDLYEKLGFTLSNRVYRCECKSCGFLHCGEMVTCNCKGNMEYEEMTLSSEHHLYRLFKDNNIQFATSGYPMSPYRFR